MKRYIQAGIALSFLALLAFPVAAVGRPQSIAQQTGEQPTSASGKLRSCQVREAAIKRRMEHLVRLATNMENTFDRHAQGVENFYTTKVVPSGKTVTNYSALVSDIAVKKAAVQTALSKAQTDVASFSCASGTPKSQMTQFRMDMRVVKRALKEYRASIKNLIVAVHSVVGKTQKATPTRGV